MDQLIEFFRKLMGSAEWPPRWYCGHWSSFHGWLYIAGDILIAAAYFSIPLIIIKYISRRQDVKFTRLYFLFAAFILACGTTHLLDALAFWVPVYRLNALVLVITGILSWVTVFHLIKLLPVAFSLKSGTELEAALDRSTKEITDYKYALDESAIVAITDQRGIIKYVNSNFCKISKYSSEELIGQDHRIINSGYHPPAFIRNLWVTIASGNIWKGELKNRAKDGEFYWVDTTIIPFLNGNNKPYQYVAIRSDITARKQSEDAFRKLNEDLEQRIELRTRELEAAVKEMEAFTYSVSHDLRAPLRSIVGFANMLEEDHGEKMDAEGKRIITVVKSNTLKMGRLIDDLLTFSRVGKINMPKTRVNMHAMVMEIINEQTVVKQNSHIDWNVQPLPPAAANIQTIRQVWINLLSNAVKYSGTRKEPHIEVGSFMEEGHTVYFVKDNGVGFDIKYKDKLFKVFQRLHSQEEFEGTGVGLALADKIIFKHGGKIWAQAEPDNGACFYFSLPPEISALAADAG